MIKGVLNWWLKRKTKDFTEIPLFFVTFNLRHYQEKGTEGCCTIHCQPEIMQDEEAVRRIKNAVDYIRENFDMEKLIKF